MTSNICPLFQKVGTPVGTSVGTPNRPDISVFYRFVPSVPTKQINSLRASRSTNTIGPACGKHARGLSFHRGVIFGGDTLFSGDACQKTAAASPFLVPTDVPTDVPTGRFTYPLKPKVGTRRQWDMSRDIKREAA